MLGTLLAVANDDSLRASLRASHWHCRESEPSLDCMHLWQTTGSDVSLLGTAGWDGYRSRPRAVDPGDGRLPGFLFPWVALFAVMMIFIDSFVRREKK